MTTLNQRSMTGGELAPSLYARVDTAKYQSGLRTCRNFEVMRHGGVQNRPGTKYLAEVKAGTTTPRLIPFVYSDDQSYVLEFGHRYVRIYQAGAQLGPGSPTAWANTTAYTVGQLVSYSGTNYYCQTAHTSATANDRPSTGTNWTVYWYAMPAGVLEIPSPYAQADLALLKYVQSADVMTLTHSGYSVYELSRIAATEWKMEKKAFLSAVAFPTGVLNNGAAVVTQKTIGSVTKAAPAVITIVAHGLTTGDTIQLYMNWLYTQIDAVTGNRYPQNLIYNYSGTVSVLTVDTFTFAPTGYSTLGLAGYIDTATKTYSLTSGYIIKTGTSSANLYTSAYVVTSVDSLGVESEPSLVTGTSTTATVSVPVIITWNAVTGISKYNVYKKSGALYGFIGTAGRGLFTDVGTTPDLTYTAPFSKVDLFQDAGDYPSCPGYYQQRLMFGNSDNRPETVWGSRIGNFTSFSKRQPLQADDSVEFTLAGRKVSAIKHILDLGKLIIFTSSGEYAVNGDGAGILTPTDVNVRQYSNFGCNDMAPIQIGNNALYVQSRGTVVRDLAFDFTVDGYKGNDLTLFAAHLFDKYTLVDWAHQQIPHSIIWAVRSDGTLLGLTYIPDQQIWGWHRHDTDGSFLNVCTIPEGSEDAVYTIVSRTGGIYVERLYTRKVEDIQDSVFMDSALTYDGRNTGATTMTLTGSGWTYTDTLTLTASVATFTAGDVGNQFWLTGTSGGVIRCTVNGYTSSTVVSVTPHATVPASLQATATTTWTKAVDSVSGLDHLEGKNVSVFGDGFVVASPNNSSYTVVTVTGGVANLDKPYGVIHVGLPYICDVETLDIDTAQGETIADKKKLVTKVSVYTEDSRGMWIGPKVPTASSLDGLTELKAREGEGYDSAVDLATGVVEVNIRPEWNSNGRVFIRQVDPIPLAVLAVAPAGYFPMRG